DVVPAKAEALRRTIATRRGGDARAEVVLVPEGGPPPFPPASFDAVLVDAPCSNTGVLRRRPEVRWRLRPEDLAALAALQDALIAQAVPLVRAGGRLVYATCSIEPEENAERAARLLHDHPSLARLDSFAVPPGRERDGGFAVAFSVGRAPGGAQE